MTSIECELSPPESTAFNRIPGEQHYSLPRRREAHEEENFYCDSVFFVVFVTSWPMMLLIIHMLLKVVSHRHVGLW